MHKYNPVIPVLHDSHICSLAHFILSLSLFPNLSPLLCFWPFLCSLLWHLGPHSPNCSGTEVLIQQQLPWPVSLWTPNPRSSILEPSRSRWIHESEEDQIHLKRKKLCNDTSFENEVNHDTMKGPSYYTSNEGCSINYDICTPAYDNYINSSKGALDYHWIHV